MISTKKLQSLPNWKELKTVCKAMAVLDAILSPDWVYRYYSYDSIWSENEEFFEMRNGEGGQLFILFRDEGAVINGYTSESDQSNGEQSNKEALTDQMPAVFDEFMFGEPVNSSGTTFCVWTNTKGEWTTGLLPEEDDYSEELLSALDGNAKTYTTWASKYYEGSYVESGIPLETVTAIFNQEQLTTELVLSLVDHLDDWEQLKDDLTEISYQYHIIH